MLFNQEDKSRIEKANQEVQIHLKNIEDKLENYSMNHDAQDEMSYYDTLLSNKSNKKHSNRSKSNISIKYRPNSITANPYSNRSFSPEGNNNFSTNDNYLKSEPTIIGNSTIQDSMNRKFNILFREVASIKDSRAELKLMNESLLGTRKMIYTIRENLESKLKEFEQILYSNLDLDMKPTEINILPKENQAQALSQNQSLSTSNLRYPTKSKFAEMKSKKEDMMNGIFKSLSINNKSIESIESTIATIEKSMSNLCESLTGFELKTIEKTNSLDLSVTNLTKQGNNIDLRVKQLEEKTKFNTEQIDKITKESRVNIEMLEDKIAVEINKTKESNTREIAVVKEKINESILSTKGNIEEKINKQIAQDIDKIKFVIISEVTGTIWDRNKKEIRGELGVDFNDFEGKVNRKVTAEIDLCKSDLQAKLINIKESLAKLENSANANSILNNNQNNQIIAKVPNFISNAMNQVYNQNNQINTKNNLNRSISTFVSEKKLAKNEIKDFIIEHSDDDDDLISNKNSRVGNETSKTKTLFNRFS